MDKYLNHCAVKFSVLIGWKVLLDVLFYTCDRFFFITVEMHFHIFKISKNAAHDGWMCDAGELV